MSIGVVLGAGGIVGAAYHAGVLTALAEMGFDARDADLLVGTSAGSGVAASLRAGFPPIDLAPRNLGQPISPEAREIVGRSGGPPTMDFKPRPFSRLPVPSSPGLVLRAAREPTKALAGLLPKGTVSTAVIGERIDALYGERSWPSDPLWICAVDLDLGDRVVFGRDVDAPVGVAVQASSSIPGFFRPVAHRDRRYVDGGVHSPTNADLLADGGYDVVVIASPMSAGAVDRRLRSSPRRLHARRLAGEVRCLERAGIATLVFEPTAAEIDAMGRNPMDVERRAATTRATLGAVRRMLAEPRLADRLAVLQQASS